MFSEKQLDDIRAGKVPISIDRSGLPVVALNAPIYELGLLLRAMASGYMRLYNRNKIHDTCENAKEGRNT